MAKKILIVDDDPEVVTLLTMAMEDAGYQTFSADDGPEAIDKARSCRPDLVILDIMLPHMNGITVCEKLRKQPATKSVPVLMITGLPGEMPRLAGMEAGADFYVNKPFDLPTLVARINGLLNPDLVPKLKAKPQLSAAAAPAMS